MKTIRDILNKRCNPPSDWHDDEGNLCCHECGNNPAKALKEISELLVEAKPSRYVYKNDDGHAYHQGWNECIDDYEKNIKDLLQ